MTSKVILSRKIEHVTKCIKYLLIQSNDGNELGIYIGGILCPICKENLNPPDIDSNIDFWECISCGKRITNDAVVTLVGTLQHLLLEGK